MRAFEYQDDPKRLPRARELRPGHPLDSPAAIDTLARHFRIERGVMVHPQTYVVTASDGIFCCGGAVEEHVHVAGGEAVLAAGEVWFARRSGKRWSVERINNRSIGYRIPTPESFVAIASALDAAGIEHPGAFTEIYTGRTCTNCGQFNVWPGEAAPCCKACGEDFA